MLRLLLLLSLTQPGPVGANGGWLDVPFVAQGPGGCGPASADMIAAYWNARQALKPDPRSSAPAPSHFLTADPEKGVSGSALARSLKEAGYRTFVFRGEEADLEHHISRGRPLIVCLASGADESHFVVVVGVDPGHSLIFLNDPAQRKLLAVPWSQFEKQWGASENWTLLALPEPWD